MPLHLSTIKAVWGALRGVQAAGGWVWGQATKSIAHTIYRRSHARWLNQIRLATHWEPLGSYLEYRLFLAQATDPRPQQSILSVRVREGVTVDSASFLLEASSTLQRYQEPIVLDKPDQTPITCIITRIPPETIIHASSEHGIHFSWDEYRFMRIEVSVPGRGVVNEADSPPTPLSHFTLLNSDFKQIDGVWLNTDAIKFCKQEIASYWRFWFCSPKVFYGGPRRKGFDGLDVLYLLARPLKALMSTDTAVTVQFWAAASTFCQFTDEGRLVRRFRRQNSALDSKAHAGAK